MALPKAAQSSFDIAWAELTKHSGAIVRQVGADTVHLHVTGRDVVYTLADLGALEAAAALLRAMGGRR